MTEINGQTSDGFHTFDELYAHRLALTLALFRAAGWLYPWRSRLHHDGEAPFGGGWFVVGVTLPGTGQITYHYPDKAWSLFDNILGVRTLDRAEWYDGHTSADVVERLTEWATR